MSPDTFLCLLLLWGEFVLTLRSVSLQVGFTGVQCPSPDRFWSLSFPKFILGTSGALPAAGCPCALYHNTFTNVKKLGSSPIFFPPHSLFALPITSSGLERLWYFEREPHPPEFPGLAVCSVPFFDKMHFFSDDEKISHYILGFKCRCIFFFLSFLSNFLSSVIIVLVWCTLAVNWTKSQFNLLLRHISLWVYISSLITLLLSFQKVWPKMFFTQKIWDYFYVSAHFFLYLLPNILFVSRSA